MKLTIEPTPTVTTIHGAQCRLWNGTAEDGTPCKVFVKTIAVTNGPECDQFKRELEELSQPAELQPIDLRHIL